MTELRPLLEQRGITRAAIIDDAFDLVPRHDELTTENWTVFFDDLTEGDRALLIEVFPAYEATEREDLQVSAEFIANLWNARERLSGPSRQTLFSEYEATSAEEQTRLEELRIALVSLGLECATAGRESVVDVAGIDLVFVDLFLGSQQLDADMESAIRRAREFVRNRPAQPPLIVLMSRSTRLWEKRNEFREKAGLLGSTFRVISKTDLARPEALGRLLVRLVDHYDDAKRVAAFVNAWDEGLNAARERFVSLLRRLDLPDLAQIQTLLLEFEGQALSEYLLDVADRVLQHEIEADDDTIGAAQDLDSIDLSRYPAPHLAGSPDLQELVHRMVFQHPRRLRLSDQATPFRLEFGDLFRYRDEQSGNLTDQVILIATPACDLIRNGPSDTLVLPGTLKPLNATDWAYGTSAPKTPIFSDQDGTRYWIKWKLKGRIMLPTAAFQNTEKLRRVARMREVPAIELQQQLLVDMGRIGQVASPPATFSVTIDLYRVSAGAIMERLDVPKLAECVCFVGRDEDAARVDHLVLTEDACDALYDVVKTCPANSVHELARPSLTALQGDLDFFEQFEKGLVEVPVKNSKLKALAGEGGRVYLHICRNDGATPGDPVQGNTRNAPFIMKISDVGEA